MNDKLFELILACIPVLGAILTLYVIPYFKELIGNEKLGKYQEWAEMAVKAAEMIFTEKGMGVQKKEYVVKFLTEQFNKNKVVITEEQLNILIESCVKQMKEKEIN